MKDRTAKITITTRTVGVHFGTVGEVRRGGRIIHTTDPRPYGYHTAAAAAAAQWAIDHGYVDISHRAERGEEPEYFPGTLGTHYAGHRLGGSHS